ncbi:MAG: hypothetical protein HY053_02375 [Proteobacteria bacterium]|nr:hypothetical protein [Pseudomonadota bacterium]
MGRILYQMNRVTTPAAKAAEPARQIGNYFFLITNMMKLGLQLIWEQQHGLKHFEGIMNTAKGRELYDDIVRCVMRPEEEDSRHFQPEEIDAIAEKLSLRGLKTPAALDYLRKIIAAKTDNEALQSDGDTHQPPAGWTTPRPHATDTIAFGEDVDLSRN